MRQRTRRLEDWRAKRSGYGINMGEGSGGLQFSQGGDRWFSLFSVLEILTEMFFFQTTSVKMHAHFMQGPVFVDIIPRGFLTPLLQAWVWMHSHVTCDGTRVHSRTAVFRTRESRSSCSLVDITRRVFFRVMMVESEKLTSELTYWINSYRRLVM